MKIICIGRNYAAHIAELQNEVPSEPLLFMKPSTALLIGNKPFYIPSFSKDVHYEVELVFRITKNGKSIQKQFARSYYDEIALGIDFTARDVQTALKAKGQPWEKAKAFDSSAVVSEFIPITTLSNPDVINFDLFKNGAMVQAGTSDLMLHKLDDIICYASKFFKLHVGDYIFTGTPEGVGPVAIGDELVGHLDGREMIRMDIL